MTDPSNIWHLHISNSPLVATAIHNGHEVREEVAGNIALSDPERLQEEDPYTGIWTTLVDTQLVGKRSRFEVDLNRPRAKAVYIKPEDAWGLKVWKQEPSKETIDRSLQEYDDFYREVHSLFSSLEEKFGYFLVLDLHTYNHRRQGPNGPDADPEANPEVNVGTGTLNRKKWGPIVDRFIKDLRAFDFLGRHLDVRENVKFQGGQFPRWIHETFPESGCALAIEFKKFFMNEWTGEIHREPFEAIPHALKSTIPGFLEELAKLQHS